MSTINSTDAPASRQRKKGFIKLAVSLGIAGSLLFAFGTTGALSGFTASINNSANSVASGTLLMTETQGATTCLSSAAGTVTASNAGDCSTINKFGGGTAIIPGVPQTSTITIVNNGTVAANTFNLTPAGCTTTANGANNGTDTAGFCGKIDITIADTTGTAKCVLPTLPGACTTPTAAVNLSSIGTTAIPLTVPLAAGASRTYTFTVMLDNSATNAHQGLKANEALLWSFAS